MEDQSQAVPNASRESGNDSQNGSREKSRHKPRPRLPLPTDRLKFDGQQNALKAIVIASNNGDQGVSAENMAPAWA